MPSSSKVDVVIKNDGEEIGTRLKSPVRKRPDGLAGIVVNGRVYGLREDHTIDLADDAFDKEDCPGFFKDGEPFTYAPSAEAYPWWLLEKTHRGAYLAFNGDDAFAERLTEVFRDAGLTRGFHPSFRPAKNGYFYDFYIRLPSHLTDTDVESFIDGISPSESDSQSHEGTFEAIIRNVEKYGGLAKLTSVIAEALQTNAELEKQLTALRKQSADDHERQLRASYDLTSIRTERIAQDSEIASLKAKINKLRAYGVDNIPAGLTDNDGSLAPQQSEIAFLSEQLADANRRLLVIGDELELSILEKSDLSAQVYAAKREIGLLNDEVAIWKAESRPTEIAGESKRSSSKRARQKIGEILAVAFPRLSMEGDDFDSLLTEFERVTGVAEVLATLQANQIPKGAEKFKGYPGLWEIRNISTGIPGRGNMGRIYYRGGGLDGKLDVAIHIKRDEKEQERFVKARYA